MSQPESSRRIGQLLTLTVLIGIVLMFVVFSRTDWLSPIIARESRLRDFVRDQTATAVLMIAAAYAALAALPIPFATIGAIVVGWSLGFWLGVPTVSFASTAGACLTFVAARWFSRRSTWLANNRNVEKFQRHFREEGLYYIILLRVMPGLPFFLVNACLAQTRVSLSTFWLASQIAMLPGTAVAVAAGAALPSLSRLQKEGVQSIVSWPFAVALILIAAQPLLIRWFFKSRKKPNE